MTEPTAEQPLAARVQAYLDRVVADGLPGAVGLVMTPTPEGPDELVLASSGRMAVGGAPMRTDAVFRIQSMTKAVTAVATLRLVERGELVLTDPVAPWLPELAEPMVLRAPDAELDDTVPLARPITVRDLLTLTAGHGIDESGSPYARAQVAAHVAAGPDPVDTDASDWLARLGRLPLAHQPGEGWRYHHGFMILGVLLSRVVGRPLGEHLADDAFGPLGMVDTAFWAAEPERLPAAYRLDAAGAVEIQPAGGGFWAADPGFDAAHGELVSTASDYARFARMLRDGGLVEGEPYLSALSVEALRTDQVPLVAKTPESFGVWAGSGWGYGVGVESAGPASGALRLVGRVRHRLLRRPHDRAHHRVPHPGGDEPGDVRPRLGLPRGRRGGLTRVPVRRSRLSRPGCRQAQPPGRRAGSEWPQQNQATSSCRSRTRDAAACRGSASKNAGMRLRAPSGPTRAASPMKATSSRTNVKWPGVCPGVGRARTPSAISASPRSSSAGELSRGARRRMIRREGVRGTGAERRMMAASSAPTQIRAPVRRAHSSALAA